MKKFIISFLIIVGVGFLIYGLESPESETPEEEEGIANREIEFVAEEDEEAQEIKIIEEGGEEIFSVTIDEVNEWSEDNWDDFEETPQVGPNDMSPGQFTFFDREASISPDNTKLVFSVSGYASLSTTSLVIIADLEADEMRFVGESARGTVEEFVWSDDSTKLAYTLGTARSQGDYLRVDDIDDMDIAFRIEGEDLLEAFEEENIDVNNFLPVFGQLNWEGEKLEFESEDPQSEDRLLWTINQNGENLSTR